MRGDEKAAALRMKTDLDSIATNVIRSEDKQEKTKQKRRLDASCGASLSVHLRPELAMLRFWLDVDGRRRRQTYRRTTRQLQRESMG